MSTEELSLIIAAISTGVYFLLPNDIARVIAGAAWVVFGVIQIIHS